MNKQVTINLSLGEADLIIDALRCLRIYSGDSTKPECENVEKKLRLFLDISDIIMDRKIEAE